MSDEPLSPLPHAWHLRHLLASPTHVLTQRMLNQGMPVQVTGDELPVQLAEELLRKGYLFEVVEGSRDERYRVFIPEGVREPPPSLAPAPVGAGAGAGAGRRRPLAWACGICIGIAILVATCGATAMWCTTEIMIGTAEIQIVAAHDRSVDTHAEFMCEHVTCAVCAWKRRDASLSYYSREYIPLAHQQDVLRTFWNLCDVCCAVVTAAAVEK